jgi:hypothetical protein
MPRFFTNAEYADIHFIYGFCDGNAQAAVREYRRRFPNRRIPHIQVFIDSHRRLSEFGFGKINNREVLHNPRNNRILQLFDINPQMSTRRAALQLQTSHTKVFNALKRDHRKPYHLQPVQNLLPGDAQKRINFCRWIIETKQQDPHFLEKVIWTDEANFTRTGVFNYHNLHVWAHENPHEIRPASFQNEFSCNVWMGVYNNAICGPYFLPRRLNSNLFYEFLQNNFRQLLENLPLINRRRWIQMDGAPAHYGRQIREWLNENYQHRWIGRLPPGNNARFLPGVGPIAWPPRSPDLNPLDFFNGDI